MFTGLGFIVACLCACVLHYIVLCQCVWLLCDLCLYVIACMVVDVIAVIAC